MPDPAQLHAWAARYEPVARTIFTAAIAEGRAGELLLALLDGNGCTISPAGRLQIIPITTHDIGPGRD